MQFVSELVIYGNSLSRLKSRKHCKTTKCLTRTTNGSWVEESGDAVDSTLVCSKLLKPWSNLKDNISRSLIGILNANICTGQTMFSKLTFPHHDCLHLQRCYFSNLEKGKHNHRDKNGA